MDDKVEYMNPLILQRADPWIYRHMDGKYYFTASVPEYDRIELRVASTIAELSSVHPYVVWEKHGLGEMSHLIWAPEIHFLRGKWYIYFAAAPDEDIDEVHHTFHHRMYVLEADDPVLGPWREVGQIQTGLDSFCLDATVFEYNHRMFYIWAQKDPEILGNSNLYIAEMKNPWTLKLPAVMLSKPEFDWECSVIPVNEGPAVLIREPWIYLTYSANATGPEYCMGLLKARSDADLLKTSNWEKSRFPIFKSCSEHRKYGPGHNCFVKSENGQLDLIVYHVRDTDQIQGDPLYNPNRHTCIQPIKWDEQGEPDWGVPEKCTDQIL